MPATLNRGDTVTVAGWRGVAFVVKGPTTVDDENTVWSGERVETGKVDVIMIGDDRVWHIDPEDCEPIDKGRYCRTCGQTGCTHDA